MLTLGIHSTQERIFEQVVHYFRTEPYQISKVETKEQLISIDGLLLSIETKEDFTKVVEWLLACQNIPTVFVWVFSAISLDFEEDILLELGVNNIIMTEKRVPLLLKIIKNTFQRLRQTDVVKRDLISSPLLNEKNQSILVNEEEQSLTRKEFQLLQLLYENRDTTVSYKQLIKQIWPSEDQTGTYRLSNIVFHIRKKIKENDVFMIKTVRSKGYMFVMK
ncbi:hypothetical protein CI088_01580 [Enterococcus plantarum]|uniref:OmpR/PhoB-type domain-containing protein n=1 Tax=Enterococcus plantarum TaxID=1077675 RepID=A0A2W4BVR2_9ENTE|nr:winged helix-turn-helix domain-containing protein [Enterococcus plantarum]PZL77519.1 hypothetical protein CI088_01580 [Enterococcus plantarum]